jgi:hypothetical protein
MFFKAKNQSLWPVGEWPKYSQKQGKILVIDEEINVFLVVNQQ